MASPEILSLISGPLHFSFPYLSLRYLHHLHRLRTPLRSTLTLVPSCFVLHDLLSFIILLRNATQTAVLNTHLGLMSRPQRFPSSSELKKQSAYLQSPSSASTSSTSLLPKMQQGQSTSSFTPVFMDQQSKRSSGKGPRTSYLYVSLMSAGSLDIFLISISMITVMANVEVGVRSLM